MTGMTIDEAAVNGRERIQSGKYCCSESVLLAIADYQGIDCELLMPIATGFCGGVAQMREMCGAVSGAVMGLGLINGRREPGGERAANYAAVQTLIEAFTAQFATINCYELTGGCDFRTPEGQQQYRESGMPARCAEFVEQAIRMALKAVENGTE